MTRPDLLTGDERRALFGGPLDRAPLATFYTVTDYDRALTEAKRGGANRLGFALHLALLRHPGFGLRHDEVVPDFLARHVAEQLGRFSRALVGYDHHAQTRLEHAWEAMALVGLRVFEAADMPGVLGAAARAAESTDRGSLIASAVVEHIRASHVVLPAPARINRIGVAGPAMARRLAADAVVDTLTPEQVASLDALLAVDPAYGSTPLAWLRDTSGSPTGRNLAGTLAGLAHVRAIGLNKGEARHTLAQAVFIH